MTTTVDAALTDERTWRPASLDEFVGQSAIKSTLGLMLQSASMRGAALEHVAFFGPPGLGKTTLAYIISNAVGGRLRELSAPAITKPGDLAAVLTSLSMGDVLFLDEIHALKRDIAEMLYSAMEDFKVSIKLDKQDDLITLPVQRHTLVGATTDYGLLPEPLRARFGHIFPLDLYTQGELTKVVARAAFLSEVLIDRASLEMIAIRGRGTPRLALRLFRRSYDLAVVRETELSADLTAEALEMLNVDELGLDEADRRYLRTLVTVYGGGPVGLKALATSAGLNPTTAERSIEPWLLRTGLMARTRLGRRITKVGMAHLSSAELVETI
jgi:holliday junction DNA helicase RuvB